MVCNTLMQLLTLFQSGVRINNWSILLSVAAFNGTACGILREHAAPFMKSIMPPIIRIQTSASGHPPPGNAPPGTVVTQTCVLSCQVTLVPVYLAV